MRLSAKVHRLTAPNPSLMTLDGTQVYLIGERELALIDPGPDNDRHLKTIVDYINACGARLIKILATHTHSDHLPGAWRLKRMTGATLGLFARSGVSADELYQDGDIIDIADARLKAIHTPGHASDHICFYLPEEKSLFTGDLILGRGTSAILYPDGNMAEYLASLRRLLELELERIYPGHGPVIENPREKIEEYIEHRMMRERQILELLAEGAKSSAELVREIYRDVDRRLHWAAELSVLAHLAKLQQEGRAEPLRDGRFKLI